jgi:soluble lytic murein transglycosylase
MKSALLVVILSSYLLANSIITKEWLQDKPRSIYKDFYLWQYLNQNITPDDAIWALGQAKSVTPKLFKAYAKKLNHDETNQIIQCEKMSPFKLLKKDATCIKLGLSPYKATKLSKKQIKKIITIIQDDYPELKKVLQIIQSPLAFHKLTHSETSIFYDTFLEVGSVYRANNFNYHFSKKVLKELQQDKSNFKKIIRKIVLEPKLTKPQQSLLLLDTKGLEHQSSFYLAINAIKYKKYKIAKKFLEASRENAYYKFDKDKVDFWIYQLTLDKKLLNKLSQSWDINIYSLYANEQLKTNIKNVVVDFTYTNNNKSPYDIHNPFAWLDILQTSKQMDDKKLKEFTNIFNTQETSGHLAFILERYYKYKKTFFPNPFDKYIKKYSLKRQALINAIARQESRFIPTSISPSYAMGVMQIMPFLSKALAKDLKEEYDINKQLVAPINLKYANKHLTWLEDRLKHPLFIAYAYNGGIGFTKRMLQSDIFKKGKFEPYLSMELVPYDESKRYAKKVLANYVIYYNQLHKNKISITNLLKNLKPPYQN